MKVSNSNINHFVHFFLGNQYSSECAFCFAHEMRTCTFTVPDKVIEIPKLSLCCYVHDMGQKNVPL